MKRRLGTRDPLEAEATFLDLTLDELVDEIAETWADHEAIGHDVVPQSWLGRRRRIEVAVLDGTSFVDVEHPDTISALELLLGAQLVSAGVGQLTTATLRGDDRSVTVSIASALRATQPAESGIEFGSKHGGGACLALWLDDRREAVAVAQVAPIAPDDPDLQVAAARFGLRLR